jgi:hypothetical protein
MVRQKALRVSGGMVLYPESAKPHFTKLPLPGVHSKVNHEFTLHRRYGFDISTVNLSHL